ncbi:zinc transporter 2 isoform X5 [Pyrgilauda ruficollis]|uniref:zinc transporter 2 isoform X5 n=1 Tax=Pyrgilauda ruficollis TaxID=221976 RepID=UPI001B87D69C|nr:zinc transporter 2 isoform X5 [Pyrgilauda ruficollis]
MAAGDEKRHLLSEGTGGYGGARGGRGCRAPSPVRLPSGVWPGEGAGGGALRVRPKPPSPKPRFGRQGLRGGCAEGRAERGAGTGARPGAGDTAWPALPHAGGWRPPRPAAAGAEEALPGRWHLPLLHGGGSRGWVPGTQPGHPDGRCPPADGLCQHHDQPLCTLGVLTAPHQNHELRMAPGRMGLALHQTGHGHSHGAAGEPPSASVRAAFVHVLGDLLQSVGVLVASYIIFFKPQYKFVDPICTFLFSALVLGTTLTILRDVLLVLMEGTPKGMDFNAVRETLLAVRGVEAVHSLHIWALTAAQPLLSVHIAINAAASAQEVLEEASSRLQGAFRFHSTTIQVESYSEEMRDCRECQPPRD